MSDSYGTTARLNEIPKWDGTAENMPMYMSMITALCESQSLDHVLEESKMTDLPTKSEYESLDPSDQSNAGRIAKYKANKRVVAILTLGQKSAHGLATINKTKVGGHSAGVVWKVMKLWEKKYKPGDASAELELESELEKIKFGSSANDFYDKVTSVLIKYSVEKTDTDLIKLLMKSQSNTTYTMLAVEELKKNEIDRSFEDLCEQINSIQRMQKAGNSNTSRKDKEVQLASQDNKDTRSKCNRCGRFGHKAANCPSKNQTKCNCCGKTGHMEYECWEKHPERAPEWIQKKMAKQKEASGASVEKEIQMCNLCIEDQDFA